MIFYTGFSLCIGIFAMIYLIGRVIGIFMRGTPARKAGHKYQIGAGVIAIVVCSLVIQMGLTVLSTVSMASIQNMFQCRGLIRFYILHTPMVSLF